MGDTFVTILIVVFALALFLAGRELVCWYFKINERVKLRQDTNELLKKLLNK